MENPDVPRIKDTPPEEDIDAEEIHDILQIVQSLQTLDTSKPGLLRNLGVTYRECGHIPEAIDQFNRALTADANCLTARASLAHAYASEFKDGPKPDWENALYHQEIVIEGVRSGMRIFPDVDPKVDLPNLLMIKASWLRKLGRYDESRKIYSDLLEEDPENDVLRLDFIYSLCEAQCYSDVVEMLQELGQVVDQETHRTRLSRFFHTHVNNANYHSTIFRAFQQVGNILEIKSHYRQAMDDASKDKNKQDFTMKTTYYGLTYYFAALLYNHGNDTTEKEEAIKLWERVVAIAKTERSLFMLQIYSARRLAKIYIAKAIEAGRDSSIADEMLRRLKDFAPELSG
jgi:tetratricopeptide (TPR) repeat protein